MVKNGWKWSGHKRASFYLEKTWFGIFLFFINLIIYTQASLKSALANAIMQSIPSREVIMELIFWVILILSSLMMLRGILYHYEPEKNEKKKMNVVS